MKAKSIKSKILCLASAIVMAATLFADPVQAQAAGEVYTSELTG